MELLKVNNHSSRRSSGYLTARATSYQVAEMPLVSPDHTHGDVDQQGCDQHIQHPNRAHKT